MIRPAATLGSSDGTPGGPNGPNEPNGLGRPGRPGRPGGADWPDPPDAVRVGRGGFVSLIESSWRRRGMVSLHWQPPAPSRFWREHGVLSVLVNALVSTPGAGGGPSVLDRLETAGVTVGVQESEFHCVLELTGDHGALLGCVPVVRDALAAFEVSPDALVAAERRFAQERSMKRRQRMHRARTARWRAFLAGPERLWRDFGPPAGDDGRAETLAAETLAAEAGRLDLSGVVVIGTDALAAGWPDARTEHPVPGPATVPITEPVTGPITGPITGPVDAEPVPAGHERVRTLAPGGPTLVSYGAVREIASADDAFGQELAVEMLAGWTGSPLSVLLRHELALTYAVTSAVRVVRLADRAFVHWNIDAMTAADDAEGVRAQIERQLDRLADAPPTGDQVRRAALRLLRRSRLSQDSVSGIMATDGHNARMGMPELSARRWEFLTRADPPVVTVGWERTRSEGVFVLVGGGRSGSAGADGRA